MNTMVRRARRLLAHQRIAIVGVSRNGRERSFERCSGRGSNSSCSATDPRTGEDRGPWH